MEENNTRPKMPPEIAKAVVEVKKRVRQIGKDDENKFAHFKYVSVDKFYDAVGRVMADAGIFVVTDEVSVTAEKRETQTDSGQVKSSMWLTATYELTLFHESGVEYGPIHRTIMVPATGPQAFGSGMSYVEKYFLRSLFKIPTGDEDADAEPPQGIPSGGGGKKPPGTSAKPPTAAAQTQTNPNAEVARGHYNRIVKLTRDAADLKALAEIVTTEGSSLAIIKGVSEFRYDELMAGFQKREDALRVGEGHVKPMNEEFVP